MWQVALWSCSTLWLPPAAHFPGAAVSPFGFHSPKFSIMIGLNWVIWQNCTSRQGVGREAAVREQKLHLSSSQLIHGMAWHGMARHGML